MAARRLWWIVALAACQRGGGAASRARDGGKPADAAESSSQSSPTPSPAPAPPLTPVWSPPQVNPDRPPPPLPEPLPGKRRALELGDAVRVAIGDLDGDGRTELVVADTAGLRVLDRDGGLRAQAPAPGGPQVLATADVDGDHRAEILVGWGEARGRLDAPATVALVRLGADGALHDEVVATPATTRAEITAIVPTGDGLVLGYFADKYTGVVARAVRGPTGWSSTELARARMAAAYARGDVDGDGAAELVVGRIYGDAVGVDGDAYLLRADGTRVAIPTTRGARAVAIADLDGDRRAEVYLADGWHQSYLREGRGLVTRARWDGHTFQRELVEDTAGQYTAGRLLVGDVDGDGRPELVSVGSHYVRVFHRDGARWRALTVAGAALDVALGDLDGAAGDELVVLGQRAEVVSLRGVTWPE